MSLISIYAMEMEMEGKRELRLALTNDAGMLATASVAGVGKAAMTLYQVFVAKEWRGKRMGTALVRKAELEAERLGATAMSAIVEADGPVGFWERLGYAPVHYEDGKMIVSKQL